nr:vacuolar proton-inorganic pyrophosphatase [Tanacetum cinerariifolium]
MSRLLRLLMAAIYKMLIQSTPVPKEQKWMSDGKEVVVDNRYLKANYPLLVSLLINQMQMAMAIMNKEVDNIVPRLDLIGSSHGGRLEKLSNYSKYFKKMANLWAGLIIGFVSDRYTSNTYSPVQDVANSYTLGAATNVIFGLSSGYKQNSHYSYFCNNDQQLCELHLCCYDHINRRLHRGYAFVHVFYDTWGVLDEGLLQLMSDKDVIRFLDYVPRFREVGVYIETSVALVERQMMERMTKWNQSSQAGKDGTVVANEFCVFDYDNKLSPLWSTKIMLENRTKGLSDEFEFRNLLEEIDHGMYGADFEQEMDELLFYRPNKAGFVQRMEKLLYYDIDDGASITLDELDQVIEAQDVSYLFVIYDQLIDDEWDVVQVEVVAKQMVAKEAFDSDDADDEDVIPTKVYDAIVAQEMLKGQDGDVIPTEVYDAMIAQAMLEDQTRAIKRRSVMADKEDGDDAQ